MQFGQSACMYHISYGLQCRQDRRYIAVIKGPHNKKFTSAMLFGVWYNGWLRMACQHVTMANPMAQFEQANIGEQLKFIPKVVMA